MLHAFEIQSRVIHALILRETRTRFDRNKLGYLWALFEPVSYIVVLISIFSAMGRATPIGSNLDLAVFFLTGMVPWLLFSHTVNKVMSGINSNRSLLTYPQVKPFDVLIARALLEFATMTVVLVVLFLVLGYYDLYHPMDSFLGMLSAAVSLWMLAVGIGFINASILLYMPSWSQTYAALQRPFFFISGIFFIAEELPANLREIVLYNPILHATEWFRSAYFQSFESAHMDKQYLLSFSLVFFAVGLAAMHKNRKFARQMS